MGLLATLKVMLGIDSVDFTQKLRTSAESVGLFESNFGKRTALVERHGLRLVNTADSIAMSMKRMSVDSIGAIGQIAEAAGFIKLGIVLAMLKTAYDTVGTSVKLISRDWMDANKPLVEITQGIEEGTPAFENLVLQLDQLAHKLGSSALQMGVLTDVYKGNVGGLVALREALLKQVEEQELASRGLAGYIETQKKLGNNVSELENKYASSIVMMGDAREAQARFNAVHGQFLPTNVQYIIAVAAGAQKMKEFADVARRSAGILNAEDLRAKAEALQRQVVAIAQSGGSASQTVAKLGDDFKTVIEIAKELGVQLPPEFERAAEAIAQGPGDAVNDLFASFRGLPKEIDASRAASAATLAKMGKDLQGTISGGFGKGAEEGVSFAEQQVTAWVARLEATPIKLSFDASDLQRIIDAVIRGRVPVTTSSAP
jgi:hypothetical protein